MWAAYERVQTRRLKHWMVSLTVVAEESATLILVFVCFVQPALKEPGDRAKQARYAVRWGWEVEEA